MRKLVHPLGILALLASPFVLYSVWRTGCQVVHLFNVRLLGIDYIWHVVLLTSAVVACCFCYRRKEQKIFSVVSALAIGAFLALQATEPYPTDYKLWIYVVAPIFAWTFVLSSGLVFAIQRIEKKA